MLDNKITLILTLKGRENFTIRFFDYVSQIDCPYKILIGDGDPFSKVKNHLHILQKKNIPFEYIMYNDSNVQKYLYKLSDLLSMVSTPYVMICDNDDFFLIEGLKKLSAFLDANKDYVSCSGNLVGFHAINTARGMEILSEQFVYENQKPIEDNLVDNRIKLCFHDYFPSWYNLCRIDEFRKVVNIFIHSQINDFTLMEIFFASLLLLYGKAGFIGENVHYIRQMNSSALHKIIPTFLHRIVCNDMGSEITKMKNVLAECYAEKTNTDKSKAVEFIEGCLFFYFNNNIKKRNKFLSRYVYTGRYLLSNLNILYQKYELNSIIKKLKLSGAQPEQICSFLREYKVIRQVVIKNLEAKIV